MLLRQSGIRWLLLAAIIFIADISIKYAVLHYIEYGWEGRIEILPFFNLLHVHNYGAAFSFLSEQPGWQRWLFSGLAVMISIILIYAMSKLTAYQKWDNISYALIIGGALGNAFDRMIRGFVIDYLDVFIGMYHWPTFNLADSAISIGAVMLIFSGSKKAKAASDHM